jgi:hypothetical protein
MDRQKDRRMDGQTDGWTKQMDESIGREIDRQMDGSRLRVPVHSADHGLSSLCKNFGSLNETRCPGFQT